MKPIYLEPDEEITSVIDKLSSISDRSVAVVVPKNSSLFQSLINLKLLSKEAQKQDKKIALISTNKVGQRLAAQVGLTTYNSLGAVGPISESTANVSTTPSVIEEDEIVDGVRVHRYRPVANSDIVDTSALTEEEQNNLPTVGPEIDDLPAEVDEKEDSIVTTEKKATSQKPIVVERVVEKIVEKPAAKTDDIGIKTEKEVAEGAAVMVSADDVAEPPHDLPPVISRGFTREREPFVMPWRSVIAATVLLIIAAALIFVFLPRATATITFPAKADNQTLTLTAQTAGDGTDLNMAGTVLTSQKEVSKSFSATGKKDIGTKATGTITLYNNYTGSPISLAAGTTLSVNSNNFSLNSAVTIPGITVAPGPKLVPGQVSAAITAVLAGSDANVTNATFVIKGQPSSVNGSGSTTGGVSKQVTVLTQADIDGAINDLKTQANTQALSDLQGKLNGQTLLDGSTWQAAPKQTVTNVAGDQVDTATATYTVEYDAIVYNSDTALAKIKDFLSKDLTKDQQLVIQNSATDVTYTFKSLAADKSSMAISAAVQAYIINNVDKAAISKAISNKSVSQAKSIVVNNYGATDASIAISPSWWIQRLPVLSGAIKIEYSFNQTQ